jgi:hypothetical protein
LGGRCSSFRPSGIRRWRQSACFSWAIDDRADHTTRIAVGCGTLANGDRYPHRLGRSGRLCLRAKRAKLSCKRHSQSSAHRAPLTNDPLKRYSRDCD